MSVVATVHRAAFSSPGPLTRCAWRTFLRVKLAVIDRRKYQRIVVERIDGISLIVLPDVFNPKLLRSGEYLVNQLDRPDLLPWSARVLDLGCGSGAAGLWAAARRSCTVIASDINPSAVRCARINALLNQVDLDIRQGDLFTPVAGELFDVVLFNPPYYRGVPRDDLDHAWRSPDVIDRFASQLRSHLRPGGHALLVLSSDGEPAAILDALDRDSLSHTVVARRDFINEIMTVYQVRPC